MKYAYSFDQDEYTGQFDSFDEAYRGSLHDHHSELFCEGRTE